MKRVHQIGYQIARYQLERAPNGVGWLQVLVNCAPQICHHLPLEDIWRIYTKTCRGLRGAFPTLPISLRKRVRKHFNFDFSQSSNIFETITLNKTNCLGGCGKQIRKLAYMVRYCLCRHCFFKRYTLEVTSNGGRVWIRKRRRN